MTFIDEAQFLRMIEQQKRPGTLRAIKKRVGRMKDSVQK